MIRRHVFDETDSKDRPTEAAAHLRDIAEWLRADGEPEIADSIDDAADYIVKAYKV